MDQPQNSQEEKDFFSAVKAGDLATVKRMAGERKELLSAYDYDEFGGPCLNLVVGHRANLEMAQALLELGADVNQKSDWWAGPWSPALLSLNYNDNGIAKFLLTKGAEVDVHLAAGLSLVDRLEEILDEDPKKIQERGGDGCLPLHFSGSPAVVDLLIDRGADMEARDIDHYSTAVHWCAGRNHQVAQYLFDRGAKADIFSAALSGAEKAVAQLIKQNSDVLNWRMNQQYFPPGPDSEVHNIMTFTIGADATPLHAATAGNHPQVISQLVEMGMDVNIKGAYDSSTALHMAAWNNSLESAVALLNCKAAIEQESGEIHQNTPMGWAIVAGSVDVAAEFLSHGCELRDYYVRDAKQGAAGALNRNIETDMT